MTIPKAEVARVAASLTKAQREALFDAATLLDHFAGEGAGMLPKERMGETLWADDVVLRLSDAFGIEWGDDFGASVAAHLQQSTERDT